MIFLLLLLGTGALQRDHAPPKPVGITGDHSSLESFAPVYPSEAEGARYLPGSSVLRLPGGDLLYLPSGESGLVRVPASDPGAREAIRESRTWLRSGNIPGANEAERALAERALLDLRLLTRPNGASIAAPHPGWNYVWPRDASWAAAAFAVTGHREEARSILHFLASVQREDGTWEARYHITGEPVADGRAPQLDGNGWFLWSVWFCSKMGEWEIGRELWPAARKAAGAAAASLGRDGLPPPGPDYWETPTEEPNLGTAAPLLTGLRAASDLARRLGEGRAAERYAAAAVELDAAIERSFAPNGYSRTPDPESGADSAAAWLGPPFAPEDPQVRRSIEAAISGLAATNGGLRPGENWRFNEAWTPETAFFALSAAAGGDEVAAGRWLRWLAEHRAPTGSFPEKVAADGRPVSVAPLGWTGAVVLLTLAAREERLPVPVAGVRDTRHNPSEER